MSVVTMPDKFQKMFYGSNKGGYIDDDASDESELGPALIRARTTKIRKYRSYRLALVSKVLVLEFEYWIENVAKLRKEKFYWTDPVSGIEKIVRFSKAPNWYRETDELYFYDISIEDM